jgi:hypothetical protein
MPKEAGKFKRLFFVAAPTDAPDGAFATEPTAGRNRYGAIR